MYDLIIIGGGPAALSAAFYAAGKKLKLAVICEDVGGKIGWLESLTGPDQQQYLPGNELAHLLTVRAISQPQHFIHDRVTKVVKEQTTFYVTTEESGVLQAATVLIATGATPRPLDVPGAEHLVDRGLGYSSTTFAHLVENQRVAIIGDTNRAISGAAELARSAAHVLVIAARSLAHVGALGEALRRRPNVEVLEGAEVTALHGKQHVTAIEVAHQDQMRYIPVDRVFVALGLMPNSSIVSNIVETNADGFILVNAYHETSLPGLYAAGDVSTIFCEQVLSAIGDGARAAMTAYDYLLARWLAPTA